MIKEMCRLPLAVNEWLTNRSGKSFLESLIIIQCLSIACFFRLSLLLYNRLNPILNFAYKYIDYFGKGVLFNL